jgi:hypothetical protein
MAKILIATPAYGQVFYKPYIESVLKLVKVIHERKLGFSFRSISYAEISESRNYLLTTWIDKTDASHILFVDADMGFDPQLILDMVVFDKPVVGVAYPKRNIDLTQIATLAQSGLSAEDAVARAQEFVLRPLSKKGDRRIIDGFMEVEGCGAGILLIQRSCIEAMLRVDPALSDTEISKTNPLTKDLNRLIRAFDIIDVDGVRLSEDLSFCSRWRSLCGGEIWVSINHAATHLGLKEFKGRYADILSVDPSIPVRVGQTVTGRLKGPIKLKVTRDDVLR